MYILFVGDVVGKPGRDALKKGIGLLNEKYQIDFIIVNGENVSHGRGLLEKHYDELIDLGVDVITLGNHFDNKIELKRYINQVDNIVRPLNIIESYPGKGSQIFDVNGIKIRVTNILGSVFMTQNVENPYQCLNELLNDEELLPCDIHIVDFHGEATSEKQCIAYAFDGMVSALLGTHTHVQTNDARILEKHTAFMCDVGMCGSFDSVLGFEKQSVLKKVLYGKNNRFEIDEKSDLIFNAVLLEFDKTSHICTNIIPINEVFKYEQ